VLKITKHFNKTIDRLNEKTNHSGKAMKYWNKAAYHSNKTLVFSTSAKHRKVGFIDALIRKRSMFFRFAVFRMIK